jgi:hypothetical protein
MNDGSLFSRRLAWSARILASHNMGTNDASSRLRRAYSYPCGTLINELQRHARHVGLFLSRHECDGLLSRLKVPTLRWPTYLLAAWTFCGGFLAYCIGAMYLRSLTHFLSYRADL